MADIFTALEELAHEYEGDQVSRRIRAILVARRVRPARLQELHDQASEAPTSLGAKQAYINGLEYELGHSAHRGEAGLRKYVEHKAGCEKAEQPGNDLPCTCGLDAALARPAEGLSPWIPVNERLPEVIEAPDGSVNCVLVYQKDGFECGSDIQVVNTVWFNQRHPLGSEGITHWMPLPEPPKEQA